ncbi:MAG: hypothetical protein ACOZIN_11715, partial [Myxococcota bacterium]
MGFLKKIVKGVSKGIKSIGKGLSKFVKSPLGKLLIAGGLTALTLGAAAPLLAGAGLSFGSVGSMFTGFASKFMGPVTSLLSKTGLSSLGSWVKTAMNSSDLLEMAKGLFTARQQTPQPAVDPSAYQVANYNVSQLMA